ncbi:MAG TPA: exodeoxyribonuclease VII large subunit [Rhodopila sp.]|uniref:exodeoxyribonuclease VII large subunit n=1 Tax=Rhodopila sp. TaxID=2480087 RepID=UPI002B908C3A|nr:exodeoxyribonuclease VII large subunit [Rhodopila sp.]HVY16308.1 exodeoxyribonuclease VII large subunit [Rhodopila sp.]
MDDPRPSLVSNMPEYTVSEISGAVKRTLETTFGRIRVRGELTEVKRYPSGHIYLSLKDENAKIAGVVWKTAVPRLGLTPENGTEVIATGRISAYGERSSYQLIIERLEYAGVGALLARIEAIRQRLAAEGLFDADRKQPLPGLPAVIGVVTSERGAVIQDIRTTIERRFPRRILLWPVPVQGEGAAQAIAEAIAGFDAMRPGGDPPRPDVLIVGRGGGSLEDLMPFNEEIVVRAAAACRIPLISAVGHETDTTLIDFVSDRRAPTPTAAAEMAIPPRLDLVADLTQKNSRLLGALNRMTQTARLHLTRVERGIPDLPSLLNQARQRLDDRSERAAMALPALVARCRTTLVAVERRLPDPRHLTAPARTALGDQVVRLRLAAPGLVTARRTGLDSASHRLIAAAERALAACRGKADRILPRMSDAPLRALLREARAHLAGLTPRLEAASPLALLQRGYVLVTNPEGQPVTAAKQVKANDRLRLHFGDGEVDTVAQGGSTASPKRGTSAPKPGKQATFDL